MQLKFIDGRFKASEADLLVTRLIETKISFHEQRIRTIHLAEEDIKHSESRIRQLKESLRQMQLMIKSTPGAMVDLDAEITINIIK